MCLNRCHGEEFESCGNDEYFVVYQTQVQGKSSEAYTPRQQLSQQRMKDTQEAHQETKVSATVTREP